MTDASKDEDSNKKYVQKPRTKRDKRHDRNGVPYDRRKGTWTASDRAEVESAVFMDTWLTRERCEVELEVLNPPGKRGPPFLYPPSLVMFVCPHMADVRSPAPQSHRLSRRVLLYR